MLFLKGHKTYLLGIYGIGPPKQTRMHFSPSQSIGHIDGRLLSATANNNFPQYLKFFTQPGGHIFALYQSPVVKGHR